MATRYSSDEVEAIVVIPFRNRDEDLKTFKRTVPAAFKAQNVKAVFVMAHQTDDLPFNRGLLINAGWKEGIKRYPRARGMYFHDVDVWPVSPTALYYGVPSSGWMSHIYGVRCTDRLTSWGGGVGGISKLSLYKTNGYPNDFWGWGAEDNVFANRMKKAGVKVDVKRKVIRGDTTKVIENNDTERDKTRHSENAHKFFSGSSETYENGLSNSKYELVRERVDEDEFIWFDLDLTHSAGAAEILAARAAAGEK